MSDHVSTAAEAATATMRAIVAEFIRANCTQDADAYTLEIDLIGDHDGEGNDNCNDNFALSVIMTKILMGCEFTAADVDGARGIMGRLIEKGKATK